MRKTIFLIFIVAIFGACSVKNTVKTNTNSNGISQADVDRVKNQFPDVTVAQLETGKSNFEKYCTACHKLKNPKDFTEEQWSKLVPGMSRKANKEAGSEIINQAAQTSILEYVIAMKEK
jgi:cytochrome c5